MNKLLIPVFLVILLSGCLEKDTTPGTNVTHIVDAAPDAPVFTAAPVIAPTPLITEKPRTKYDEFVSWLENDRTNKHSYVIDSSKIYGEQYVCSQYTRDFIKNATIAGFETYAAGLKGAVKGQNEWHMLAAVVLDRDWYFVDPQTDQILKKEDMFHAYGYEYAYFSKEVFISRNNAELSTPVYYHPVIGLNGQNFLFLK